MMYEALLLWGFFIDVGLRTIVLYRSHKSRRLLLPGEIALYVNQKTTIHMRYSLSALSVFLSLFLSVCNLKGQTSQTITISGFVFDDLNNNGVKDANEKRNQGRNHFGPG